MAAAGRYNCCVTTMKLDSWITWTSKSSEQDLREHYEDLPPHGQIVVLSLPEGELKPKADAIAGKLMKFVERPTPFVAILIDLGGIDHLLSSTDLGSVAGTMAAWVRGWVAPCAIVMTRGPAYELRRMLEITKLSELDQLRVVDTRELGLKHIRIQLERVRKPELG
jgi:hypothetical protein